VLMKDFTEARHCQTRWLSILIVTTGVLIAGCRSQRSVSKPTVEVVHLPNDGRTRSLGSGAGTSIHCGIIPTDWHSWWFPVSDLLFFLLGAIASYRWHEHHLAHKFEVSLRERLEERNRIAREMHDRLLQGFQGLMFRFQTVEEMLPHRPTDARKALADALGLADQALMESRDAIKDALSAPDANVDLANILDALMVEMKEEFDSSDSKSVEFSVIVVGKPQIVDPVMRAEILRIAREAMRNAFRHSHARRIEIELTYGCPMFRLRLRDDGAGIDACALERERCAGHWGLLGMEQCAQSLGGQLDVWTKLRAGTEIELRIPEHIAYPPFATHRFFRLFRRIV
jgi:signal transduction histidine kinase